MTFFYDLNKRLAALASKQDATQISEDAKVSAPKSQLAESIDVAEAGYSAKAARAGKDIGKPGKAFGKIAKSAAERYGSKEAGERVAGAVLNKLRHPKESADEMDESAFQAAIGKKKYGEKGMKALQKAGREHASDKTMSTIRNKYDKYDESQGMTDEGNAFTGALAKTPKGGKFKVGGKEFTDTSSLEEGTCPSCHANPCECVEEGNAFTAALKATPKGGKFKVGGKEFTDTSDLEEGFADMDAWLASREKEKGTGRFDKRKVSTGTVYTRKPETFDEPGDEVSTEPKRRGRPKGKDKGPERVTAKSYKYKAGRPQKTAEDLDTDGVMMTRPSNMSSEGVDHGEYDREGDMAKEQMHTIMSAAKELHKILSDEENLPEWVQKKITIAKEYIDTARDYMLTQHAEREEDMSAVPEGYRGGLSGERDLVKTRRDIVGNTPQEQAYNELGTLLAAAKIRNLIDPNIVAEITKLVKQLNPQVKLKEKAVSKDQAIAARIARGVQKGEVKAKSGSASAEMAKMAPKELKKFAKTPTKGLPKHVEEESTDQEDAKAEKAGKKVTKDIEYDDKKDKKEKKVDETTVAGSVATAPAAKKSSGGMQFGKGVYEGYNKQFTQALTESINIESSMEECGDGIGQGVTIRADGEDAAKLMMLLKLAGLDAPAEMMDENSPDWPTDTETLDAEPNLRTYSGGLNGPKSTGQTTAPVIASQLRRQASMEESAELERNLFKTWKDYKG